MDIYERRNGWGTWTVLSRSVVGVPWLVGPRRLSVAMGSKITQHSPDQTISHIE